MIQFKLVYVLMTFVMVMKLHRRHHKLEQPGLQQDQKGLPIHQEHRLLRLKNLKIGKLINAKNSNAT